MKYYISSFSDLYFCDGNSKLKSFINSPKDYYKVSTSIKALLEDGFKSALVGKIIFPLFILDNLSASFDVMLYEVFKTVLEDSSLLAYPAKAFYHILHSIFLATQLICDCVSFLAAAILAVPLAGSRAILDNTCNLLGDDFSFSI